MSRQCLSASGAGRALTPARHLRLGGPSPRQLANITWAPLGTPELCSLEIIRYYPPSRTAIPDPKVGTHALLPLTPVPPLLGFPRLACLIHAANVRSEPGSNPSKCIEKPPCGGPLFECLSQPSSQPDSKNSISPPRHKYRDDPTRSRSSRLSGQTRNPVTTWIPHPNCQRSCDVISHISYHSRRSDIADTGDFVSTVSNIEPAMTYFRAGRTIIGPRCLSAVFGMGTGVSTWAWSPASRCWRAAGVNPLFSNVYGVLVQRGWCE